MRETLAAAECRPNLASKLDLELACCLSMPSRVVASDHWRSRPRQVHSRKAIDAAMVSQPCGYCRSPPRALDLKARGPDTLLYHMRRF